MENVNMRVREMFTLSVLLPKSENGCKAGEAVVLNGSYNCRNN